MLSKGHPINKMDFETFFKKMQQQNPFTEIQDYFNYQIQSLVLKTVKENRDFITKQLDCIYEQLQDKIDFMKKEFQLLIIQKFQQQNAQISQQNLKRQYRNNLGYEAQSQILKAKASQEKIEIVLITKLHKQKTQKWHRYHAQ
ncbi:hypothetical protein ABPG74_001912 [Tetrahymena malaccensis]